MPVSKKLNISTASPFFFQFEKEKFNEYRGLSVLGWNFWQIIKVPSFYIELKALETPNQSTTIVKDQVKIAKFFSGFFQLVKLIIKSKRRESIYFFTYASDKLSKDANGNSYNYLIYPIVEQLNNKRVLLLEEPSSEGFLMPSKYKHDINTRQFHYFISVLSRFFPFKKIETIATSGFNVYAQFAKENEIEIQLKKNDVKGLLLNFIAHKRLYTILFKILKPQAIISSEKMGSGIMAAAIDLGIPFVELQHGNIDKHYPHYQWDDRFNDLPKTMKPTILGVFGEASRSMILRNRYFRSDEVIPIGSQRIEEYRKLKLHSNTHPNGQILVILQPMMHEWNMMLLKTLEPFHQTKFIIKPHPLQSDDEIKEYDLLAKELNAILESKRSPVYSLVLGSSLVIGYFSTVLEESISIGIPTITILNAEFPEGIHSMTQSSGLKKAIRPVSLQSINSHISFFIQNAEYREEWERDVKEVQYAIYAKDNIRNINNVIDSITGPKK